MGYMMKRNSSTGRFMVILLLAVFGFASGGYASSISLDQNFSSGTTISSTQMKNNLTAVQNGVNDNNSRITNLESRRISVISYSGGNSSSSVTSTPTLYLTIPTTFYKNISTSTIMIHWEDVLAGYGSSSTYCKFEVRVDGSAQTSSDVLWHMNGSTSYNYVPVGKTAVFTGLGAGSHTISLWKSGTATGCYTNPGGWSREVIVQEIP